MLAGILHFKMAAVSSKISITGFASGCDELILRWWDQRHTDEVRRYIQELENFSSHLLKAFLKSLVKVQQSLKGENAKASVWDGFPSNSFSYGATVFLHHSQTMQGELSGSGQRRPLRQKIDRLRFESQVSNSSSWRSLDLHFHLIHLHVKTNSWTCNKPLLLSWREGVMQRQLGKCRNLKSEVEVGEADGTNNIHQHHHHHPRLAFPLKSAEAFSSFTTF